MKIFLVTQWFPPEPAPVGYLIRDLATAFTREGWDVTIVTGFPNHPSGRVAEGYKKKIFEEEIVDGLRIWRCYLWTSPNRSTKNRVISSLSFTFTAALTILMRGNPDVLFALLQPLSMAAALPCVAWVKEALLVFNVQDLHPDAPIQMGLVSNSLVIRILKRLELLGYRSADAITLICEGFKRHCIANGIPAEKLTVIENWIDLEEIKPAQRNNSFRSFIGCSESDFIVLYAGTIGLLSGANDIIAAAKLLSNDRQIKVVFVGEGSLVEKLRIDAAESELNNVVFVPFQDRSILNDVQAISDVSIVSMTKNNGLNSVPSKALGYMAAGRPVIGMVDERSETARLIQMAECGIVVPAENPEALAASIRKLFRDPYLRLQMGMNARRFLENYYTSATLTGRYIDLFKSLGSN